MNFGNMQRKEGLIMAIAAPRSVHEQVIEMRQAGSKPQECEYMRIKMKKVLEMVCQSAVEDYRVPVPDSRGLNAFVVSGECGRAWWACEGDADR